MGRRNAKPGSRPPAPQPSGQHRRDRRRAPAELVCERRNFSGTAACGGWPGPRRAASRAISSPVAVRPIDHPGLSMLGLPLGLNAFRAKSRGSTFGGGRLFPVLWRGVEHPAVCSPSCAAGAAPGVGVSNPQRLRVPADGCSVSTTMPRATTRGSPSPTELQHRAGRDTHGFQRRASGPTVFLEAALQRDQRRCCDAVGIGRKRRSCVSSGVPSRSHSSSQKLFRRRRR
jgi:hypothetical protein